MNNYTNYMVNNYGESVGDEMFFISLEQAINEFKECLHCKRFEDLEGLIKCNACLSLERLESPFTFKQLEDLDDTELQIQKFEFFNKIGSETLFILNFKELEKGADCFIDWYFKNHFEILNDLICDSLNKEDIENVTNEDKNEWLDKIEVAKQTNNIAVFANKINNIKSEIINKYL